MKTVGIILIVLGIIALAYQGISYTSRNEVADVGGLSVTTTEHRSIPLPPILGGLALAVGIILVIAGASAGEGRTTTNVTEIHHHHEGGGTPSV